MSRIQSPVRTAAFLRDVRALGDELRADRRSSDVAHLARISLLGRSLTLLGLGVAWWALNPLSVVALALGGVIRWTIVAHHILHGAFDERDDAPSHWTSRTFARGWRRILDWADWIPPRAWVVEHNSLHHHRLGETYDPDEPVANFAWLRAWGLRRPFAAVFVFIAAAIWRPVYYGPNTVRRVMERKERIPPTPFDPFDADVYLPTRRLGREVWLQVWLPTLLLRFVLLPLCFLPLGLGATLAVLANLLVAEVLANLHAFAIIVPSHAGDDILRFDTPPQTSDEALLRQLHGTANYRTGGAVNDLLHGYLNYQVEHHLWPDLAPAQLVRAQPRLQELCEQYGMPYLQDSVWRRLAALLRDVLGETQTQGGDAILARGATAHLVPNPTPIGGRV